MCLKALLLIVGQATSAVEMPEPGPEDVHALGSVSNAGTDHFTVDRVNDSVVGERLLPKYDLSLLINEVLRDLQMVSHDFPQGIQCIEPFSSKRLTA